MSEFVGRTGSLRVYSYPEPRRPGAPAPEARNFATAKGGALSAGDNTISWVADVPAAPVNLTQVPITPILTGVIEISGFVVIAGSVEADAHIEILISVNGVAVPATMESEAIVPTTGMLSIPYMAQVAGLALSATVPVTMVIASDIGAVSLESGVMAVQEVPVSTG